MIFNFSKKFSPRRVIDLNRFGSPLLFLVRFSQTASLQVGCKSFPFKFIHARSDSITRIFPSPTQHETHELASEAAIVLKVNGRLMLPHSDFLLEGFFRVGRRKIFSGFSQQVSPSYEKFINRKRRIIWCVGGRRIVKSLKPFCNRTMRREKQIAMFRESYKVLMFFPKQSAKTLIRKKSFKWKVLK